MASKQLFGFNRRDTKALMRLIDERSGLPHGGVSVASPAVGRRLGEAYIAVATTGVPAFDSGTNTPGSNTVTIYNVNSSGVLASTGQTLQVNNLYGEIASGAFVRVTRDTFGKWWADEPRTPICQFTLNADFDTTDATVAATVTKCSHKAYESSTITLNNHPASTNYIFEGDEDDAGSAWYDGNNGEWHILQMECP